MIVVLIVFGPEKMKDIGKQMGRAIREIRRAGNDFKSTLEGEDNHYHNDYNPPKYDSYGNTYDSSSYTPPSIPEEDVHPAITAAPPAQEETPRGDFAAAALSDSSEEYGVAPAPTPPAVPSSAASAPVYGVLTTPEQSVPREKSTTH